MTCAANAWVSYSLLSRESGATIIDGAGAQGSESRFRWVLLAALLAYTLGAALKRAPFYARVPELAAPAHTGCLCVAWFVLHTALVLVAAAFCVAEGPEVPQVVSVVGLTVLSVLPTAMAVRMLVRPKASALKPGWRTHPLRESLADLCIGAAVLLSTWFWNENVAELFYADFPGASFGDRLIGTVLAAGSFAMFYAAPRFVFLLEDHARWGTWLSMSSTLLPLLARLWL
jgi:hypothetical protein